MTDTASYGLYGLGTMGGALALTILDNGSGLHVSKFEKEAQGEGLADKLTGADSPADMVKAMPDPACDHYDGPMGEIGGRDD